MQPNALSAAVYETICSMHRRNRTVASAYDTPLSPMVATVLPEIEANPGVSLVELQASLHLDQVSTTRLIQGIVKDGLAALQQSKIDKRRREIRLTRQGRKLFEISAARAHATFLAAYERVPVEQRHTFLRLFRLFNDGLGANAAAELPNDPPGMREIRRISRVLGILGRAMFGVAECSPLEWHVFDLLSAPDSSSFVVELAELIGAQPKTTAALVQRLAAQSLIKQTVNSQDKRIRAVTLTASGRALHRRRRTIAEKSLLEGLAAIASKEQEVFCSLLRLYAGVDLPSTDTVVTSSLVFRQVRDLATLPILRSFIYKHRVLQGLTESSSVSILAKDAFVYAVWSGDTLVAVTSFVPGARKGVWQLEHMIWVAGEHPLAIKQRCILKIIDQFASITGCTSLEAARSEISQELRDALGSSISVQCQLA